MRNKKVNSNSVHFSFHPAEVFEVVWASLLLPAFSLSLFFFCGALHVALSVSVSPGPLKFSCAHGSNDEEKRGEQNVQKRREGPAVHSESNHSLSNVPHRSMVLDNTRMYAVQGTTIF